VTPSWGSWLLSGFIATLVLTTIEAGSQQARLTRMSIPYLLGSMITDGRQKAKWVGFLIHLVNGEIFALVYVALFHSVGGGVWRGLLIGLAHAVVVLLVVVPLLPSIHPRMASVDQGPTVTRQLEPPGPLALHYGASTPLFVVLGHAAYGIILGVLYKLPGT
jgi:uncharacterized membrane protein YagU involved in acid resistance